MNIPPKIIAIHQPNFFPWLGFFDKIQKADQFIFLDHVLNNPRTALWTKRVKILANSQEFWLTCPLNNKKEQTFLPINLMSIAFPEQTAKKHLKTLELNYKNAPFFKEIFPYIQQYYYSQTATLALRNMEFITKISEKLNIETSFILSSQLNCEKKATDLLIEIIQKVEGTIYLAGGGTAGYQEDEKFLENNIKLVYQNFKHPVYQQFNSNHFITGLSVVDALMNLNFDGVKSILKAENNV